MGPRKSLVQWMARPRLSGGVPNLDLSYDPCAHDAIRRVLHRVGDPVTLTLRTKPANRALEHLYREHVGDVYRYALAITGQEADAEDVTQTTFMNAYRALERGEHPAKPRHWLITITHNVCRQRFRQLSRRPLEVVYEDDLAETLVPSDDAPAAGDIRRALGQLALNQREALVMRELEGRSYAEIAELLCLSVAAVETLLFRARRALREQLEGSLSCSQAESALSLQLDGCIDRSDAALLRSHLRACAACRLLARRQRAQRKGVRALALVPVPPGLSSWLGAGAAGTGAAGAASLSLGAGAGAGGLGAAVATKIAVATVAAVALGAGGYTLARGGPAHHRVGRATPVPAVTPRAVKVSATEKILNQPRAAAPTASHSGGRTHGRGPSPVARQHGRVHAAAHGRGAPLQRRALRSRAAAHAHARKSPAPLAVVHSNNGRAAVAPTGSRACGKRPVSSPAETAVDAPTTATTPADAATAPSSECPQQGHGKPSRAQP